MVKLCSKYLAAIAAIAFSASAASADLVLVTSFDSSPTPGNGVWFPSDIQANGQASVDPTKSSLADPYAGSAKLTTTSDNADKATVGITNNFGTVSDILANLHFSYDYFKQAVPGGNLQAAPALKLSFYNGDQNVAGDKYVTLIYEPYENPTFNNPTTNQWNSVDITATSGLFWQNGGFGQASNLNAPYRTLSEWASLFNSDFQNAQLVQVSMGVGTYNPGQIDYFDNVRIDGTAQANTTYNFGVAPVPEPSTIGMASTGILMVLGYARRRRKATTA